MFHSSRKALHTRTLSPNLIFCNSDRFTSKTFKFMQILLPIPFLLLPCQARLLLLLCVIAAYGIMRDITTSKISFPSQSPSHKYSRRILPVFPCAWESICDTTHSGTTARQYLEMHREAVCMFSFASAFNGRLTSYLGRVTDKRKQNTKF